METNCCTTAKYDRSEVHLQGRIQSGSRLMHESKENVDVCSKVHVEHEHAVVELDVIGW